MAVKDPQGGSETPPPVPLSEALRDFEKVVERALSNERVLPADRAYLRRYLEALRRAAGAR